MGRGDDIGGMLRRKGRENLRSVAKTRSRLDIYHQHWQASSQINRAELPQHFSTQFASVIQVVEEVPCANPPGSWWISKNITGIEDDALGAR